MADNILTKVEAYCQYHTKLLCYHLFFVFHCVLETISDLVCLLLLQQRLTYLPFVICTQSLLSTPASSCTCYAFPKKLLR